MEEWLSSLTRLGSAEPLHAAGDVGVPAYVQALLEQTAENLESLQRAVARSEENQSSIYSGLVALTERLSALGDQIATEQALLGRLIGSQEELRPIVARLVEGDSGIDEATRNHIRNMDVYLARLLDESVQGRSQMTHELRSEIKMVARTIAAAAAGEQRALSG
jgi:septal ring factor EnvC (AmiA/AmiB activator)